MKLGRLPFGAVQIGALLACIVAITVFTSTPSPIEVGAAPTLSAHDWRGKPAMSEEAWQNLLAETRESAREQVNAAQAIFRQDCAEMLPSAQAAVLAVCSQ